MRGYFAFPAFLPLILRCVLIEQFCNLRLGFIVILA